MSELHRLCNALRIQGQYEAGAAVERAIATIEMLKAKDGTAHRAGWDAAIEAAAAFLEAQSRKPTMTALRSFNQIRRIPYPGTEKDRDNG